MASKKHTATRKLYYYRVSWTDFGEEHGTMEQLLTEAHNQLSIAEKRVFDAKEGKKLIGSQFEYRSNCLLLQISLYEPDQPTSTIGKTKKGKKAKIDIVNAPDGSDFLETEIFVLVKDDHVILCSLANNYYSLTKKYLQKILEKVGRLKESSYFDLDRVANIDKIKMIHNEGIKYIELDVSMYMASFEYMERHNKPINPALKQLITNYVGAIVGLFSKDKKTEEVRQTEYLNSKIVINADGKKLRGKRMESKRVEAQDSLTKLSNLILDDDNNGYKIVTKEDSVIRADEILTAESFELQKLGCSLSCEDAWSKLISYYTRLSSKGILVQ